MRRPEGFDRPIEPRVAPAPTSTGDEPAAAEASAVDADVVRDRVPARDGAVIATARGRRRSESHAARTARLLRDAQLRQERIDRQDARRAASEARSSAKAARRVERSEVRRFTRATRRRVRGWLIGIAAVAAALGLLVALVHSPLMAVREIRVEGTSRLDASELEAALATHLGEPIATVTDAEIGDELRDFTGLRSYVVDVVPPGTIVVRVVERTPIVVTTLDGQDRMLDAAGVDLGAPDGEALPRLDGVEAGSEAFAAVTAALGAMPTELAAQVATVQATTRDDVSMQLVGGQRVVWGSADDAGLKADVLAALLRAPGTSPTATLDVSAPSNPVVRP